MHRDTPSSPPAWAFPWMAGAALLGLGASLTAAYVHHRLLTDPAYASFCDVNSTFNCTNAYLSQYGSVGGVPTAMLGVMYFGAVLLGLALWRLAPKGAEGAPGFVFAMSLVGVPVVAYLAYASVALGSLCLICLVTYVAVAVMFAVSARAARSSMSTLFSRLLSDLSALVKQPSALLAAGAFAVASFFAVQWFPATAVAAASEDGGQGGAPSALAALAPAQLQELERFLNAQQRVPVMVASEGAAVVLVKFNDYMCPPCGQTFAEYKPVLAKWAKEYPGKLKFVTKDFPLDPECNKYAPGGSHMASCEAAVAVRLAREHGKAAQMEDWLFANQPTLTPASVKEAARVIGEVTDFDARYPKTLELVRGDIEQGAQLTVQGTPTFFMNGIRLPGLRGAFLDAAIALEMKRAGVTLR
ncbi:MAG: vitamin K epoxide reductase family protein [Vicinamibacterales bacterium]